LTPDMGPEGHDAATGPGRIRHAPQ
jgi:hypothetical protein